MSKQEQPRLLSFTLSDWDVLGGDVSVSLTDGVAVLVGKNGSGKSAILEGFVAISEWAIGNRPILAPSLNRPLQRYEPGSIPETLEIEILTPSDRRLRYRYQLVSSPIRGENPGLAELGSNKVEDGEYLSWSDRCWYPDKEEEAIWTTQNGQTEFGDMVDTNLHPMVGKRNVLDNTGILIRAFWLLLSGSGHVLDNILFREIFWLLCVLRSVDLHQPEPVRTTKSRHPSVLRISLQKDRSHENIQPYGDELANKVAQEIARRGSEELSELESICQRIGLGRHLSVQRFGPSGNLNDNKGNQNAIAEVLLDGVNVGLLSDGTLRVLSILVKITGPSRSKTVIIEEPEMQIHPGLLSKLLGELAAYTYGENLTISTHSPQVVAHFAPNQINLVQRDRGRTSVRKLAPDEIQWVSKYLAEEGNLGEFIYSGILDEDE